MSRREPHRKPGAVFRFLVDIEAIVDTRLGLMDYLDPDCAVRLVSNPDYFTRVQDKFQPLCGIPEAIWKEAWKTRGATGEALKRAINTPAIDLVHYMVLEVEYRAINDPQISGAEVDLNIWPYTLSDEERLALAAALTQRVGWKAPINVICQPPQYFTPSLCKGSYYAMVLYDHDAWFKVHQSELFATTVGMPKVTMYAPRLAAKEIPPPDMCDFSKHGVKKKIDIFDAVAHGLSQYVGLEYLPVNQYCICYPGINDGRITSPPQKTA